MIMDSFMDCFFKHQKGNIKGISEVITDYAIDYTRLNISAIK